MIRKQRDMMKSVVSFELNQHKQVLEIVIEKLQYDIEKACQVAVETIRAGKKIILFGNGGSAADAQHIAAELTGRYKKERKGLKAIAITTDTSALTAIGNDYDYTQVFARQVEALADVGDLLVGISSTGNSSNVVNALELGREMGCKTLGLSGKDGGRMNAACTLNVVVPSEVTARIQEMHTIIGHIICQNIDDNCG
jgi:D-sedoheptulose 7-phosphate isomerase